MFFLILFNVGAAGIEKDVFQIEEGAARESNHTCCFQLHFVPSFTNFSE